MNHILPVRHSFTEKWDAVTLKEDLTEIKSSESNTFRKIVFCFKFLNLVLKMLNHFPPTSCFKSKEALP